MTANIDLKTVRGFGEEWDRFDQSNLPQSELTELFNRVFRIFPFDKLAKGAEGFDVGCGTGRWARFVAPRVGKLHCIDASEKALAVARKNLASQPNCEFHLSSIDEMPLAPASMDFGYCVGVLHHLPDTAAGIRACVSKLKPGAPFLVYIYYAFDNRPAWYRFLWRLSYLLRGVISRFPFRLRSLVAEFIATFGYLPLARFSSLCERLGFDMRNFPLYDYRHLSYYTLRTDALDRFGTSLERRFTAEQIRHMLRDAGFENVIFSDRVPYWCAVGYKRRTIL